MQLSEFDYDLPKEFIAQRPAEPRDSCRLLLLDRRSGAIGHHLFRELPVLLRPGDCLVLNDTRVIPARLHGTLVDRGGPIELLLLRPQGRMWEALGRPGRKLTPGAAISFPGAGVQAVVSSRLTGGKVLVDFGGLTEDELADFLSRYGEMPLPPYIREPLCDAEEYQTIYSRKPGSVAAPTAGLHFSDSLFAALAARDVLCLYVLLHVGYGTFQPVRAEDVSEHRMEEEYYEVTGLAAREINARRRAGGRVICVGTSVTRTLETVYREVEGLVPRVGSTGLFIYPGFEFQAADGLLTNFHLPKSTPLLLTAAWAGWEALRRAYSEAMHLGYRFYSFGDAMLII